ADQAGARGSSDGGQLRIADISLFHGAIDDAVEQVDMGAGGDLRHHAAEARVLFRLRAHDVGQDASAAVAVALDHGGCGFIAGGLYTQHQHRRVVTQVRSLCYRLQSSVRSLGSIVRSQRAIVGSAPNVAPESLKMAVLVTRPQGDGEATADS